MLAIERFLDRYVINLTGEAFWAYAYDGSPMEVGISSGEMPTEPDSKKVIIVDEDQYERLKESGRETHDLARLSKPMHGINDLPMRVITLYDDSKTRVMPNNNVFDTLSLAQ